MSEMLAVALTLSASAGSRAIDAGVTENARALLSGYDIIADRELAPGIAHEIIFVAPEQTDLPALRRTIGKQLVDSAIDINIIFNDVAFTRRKLLVADMESTIIEQEMLDELGDYVGRRAEIEEVTARAMRGELDFEAAIKARVGLLRGLPESVLEEVKCRITFMPGAVALIATMKANGAYCALVSGGFTVFTADVAERLGFDEHRANVIEVAGGKLTGLVREPILGREAKRERLVTLTQELGLLPAQTLAVGDGANDLDMLGAAGLGVAFRAKPKVREAAAALVNGAVVSCGDLTALLYLQGYRAVEFAGTGGKS